MCISTILVCRDWAIRRPSHREGHGVLICLSLSFKFFNLIIQFNQLKPPLYLPLGDGPSGKPPPPHREGHGVLICLSLSFKFFNLIIQFTQLKPPLYLPLGDGPSGQPPPP